VSNGEVGTCVIEARDGDSGFEAQTNIRIRRYEAAEAWSNQQ